MTIRIGLIGTGEMGSAVGARLRANGAEVVTSLAGRSPASVERMAQACVTAVASDDDVVAGSTFVLSIVPPGEALAVAQRYAPALTRAGGRTAFVDCNAIAPATMTQIAQTLGGTPCIDVGIIGGPPRGSFSPKFYASGAHTNALLVLETLGIRVRLLDAHIGSASAFKMWYGGITKGFTAIGSAMRAAAEAHGLAAELAGECAESQPELKAWLDRQLPLMPPKAYRWVAEMREIGAASDDDTTDAIYRAIAEYYAAIARTRDA